MKEIRPNLHRNKFSIFNSYQIINPNQQAKPRILILNNSYSFSHTIIDKRIGEVYIIFYQYVGQKLGLAEVIQKNYSMYGCTNEHPQMAISFLSNNRST